MLTDTISSRLTAILLVIVTPATVDAQQAANLSRKAETIHHKVETLAPNSPISVIPIQGHEEFGVLLSQGQESFTFRDIDSETDITLKYAEVRKLKRGYGGYNSLRGKHTDRTKALVITAAVLIALGAVIGAAAAAKN